MNYTTYIDNIKLIDWKLSYQEAALIDWFQRLHSWAENIQFEGSTYYFANRKKACEENPAITKKPDTMYRYYKSLGEKGIIKYIKVGNKDFIAFTDKGKQWGRIRETDSHPNKLGQPSEQTRTAIRTNSDSHPTDYIYNNNNTNKDNITIDKPEKEFSSQVNECLDNCLDFFPTHLYPKKPEKWLDTIEKLNRIDKIPFEKIIEIVKKTRENDFWSKNFLSLVKLRQKNKQGIMWVVYFNEQIKSAAPKTTQDLFNNAMQSDAAQNFRY